MATMDVLLAVGKYDPGTAIQMMKLLLDTSEEHLQEKAARQLLGWDMYDLFLDDDVLSLLADELKWNDRLARQPFQSAYVDRPQKEIIHACGRLGEAALQKSCWNFWRVIRSPTIPLS